MPSFDFESCDSITDRFWRENENFSGRIIRVLGSFSFIDAQDLPIDSLSPGLKDSD